MAIRLDKYVNNLDLAKILLYIILNVHYRIHGKKIRGREEILLGVTSRPYILKSTISSINYHIYQLHQLSHISAITPAKASPICLYPISDGCTQLVICRSKCSEYILLFM